MKYLYPYQTKPNVTHPKVFYAFSKCKKCLPPSIYSDEEVPIIKYNNQYVANFIVQAPDHHRAII